MICVIKINILITRMIVFKNKYIYVITSFTYTRYLLYVLEFLFITNTTNSITFLPQKINYRGLQNSPIAPFFFPSPFFF